MLVAVFSETAKLFEPFLNVSRASSMSFLSVNLDSAMLSIGLEEINQNIEWINLSFGL